MLEIFEMQITHVSCIPWNIHYCDVIMGTMASQITSVSRVCSTICSCADQRNHQSSASLDFVREIHRWPVNSPHKWPVTRKKFLFDDVIIYTGHCCDLYCGGYTSALNRLRKEFSHILQGCSRGSSALQWLSSYDWSSAIDVNVKDMGEIGHESWNNDKIQAKWEPRACFSAYCTISIIT